MIAAFINVAFIFVFASVIFGFLYRAVCKKLGVKPNTIKRYLDEGYSFPAAFGKFFITRIRNGLIAVVVLADMYLFKKRDISEMNPELLNRIIAEDEDKNLKL